MRPRILFALFFAFLFVGAAIAEEPGNNMRLEQRVCGLKEPFVFWLWSATAGRPDKQRLAGLPNVDDISLTTTDGRRLRGYRLQVMGGRMGQTGKAKGYLLVLPGNAMLADQILAEFSPYARAGYDVYIYDYRGYGRSEGKRRLKAMVSDIKEILAYLDAGMYEERLVYAMSFGGIVLLDGDSANALDRVVIDSTPSRLSDYGCPQDYDPIVHLPKDCSRFMFVTGHRDRVVTAAMSAELVKLAQQRNALVVSDPEFAHPFMDVNPAVHRRRMKMIKQYLLQQE